jgi:hypothetical protein
MKTVRDKYPCEEYPKLYTKSFKANQIGQGWYALVNRIMFVVGFSLISAMIMWDYNTTDEISQMIPWAFFMLQMTPMMWLEVSEHKYFKAMRAANTQTTKKASFQPRKLFDFVAPYLLALAIISFVFAVFMIYLKSGWDKGALMKILVILVSDMVMGFVVYINIYGKKQNPYQSSHDRNNQIKVIVKSIFLVIIALHLFLAVQIVIDIFEINFIEPAVMSVYLQLLAWGSIVSRLKSLKIENIDFSVYKETTAA